MSWIQKIKCVFGNHKLKVIRKLLDDSMLIHCTECKGYWGVNHSVRAILPFTKEMCEMYKLCGLKKLDKYISNKQFWIGRL